jgi:uncharacterized SAM-binding protein YcdF (DUF218 family)
MRNRMLVSIYRGGALALGGFSLLNLLGEACVPGFSANLWWIDLRPLPARLAEGVLGVVAVLLLAFAVDPVPGTWRRRATLAGVGFLAAAAVWNAVHFYLLVAGGRIQSGCPVPFSLVVSGALLSLLLVLLRTPGTAVPTRQIGRERGLVATTALLCAVAFPLAQMWCFGKTDYCRPADAIVVFGAGARADGEPSDALRERVETACELYLAGWAPRLVFSGGPGAGAVHETEAMRRLAVRLGVADADILLDPWGLDTQATVRNTTPLFARLGMRRVLAVSHFYHLPRIKLTYQRAGWEVYTVPAKPVWLLRQLPLFILREVAALWVYYVRPLAAPLVGCITRSG